MFGLQEQTKRIENSGKQISVSECPERTDARYELLETRFVQLSESFCLHNSRQVMNRKL